jgi:hypothetical protein
MCRSVLLVSQGRVQTLRWPSRERQIARIEHHLHDGRSMAAAAGLIGLTGLAGVSAPGDTSSRSPATRHSRRRRWRPGATRFQQGGHSRRCHRSPARTPAPPRTGEGRTSRTAATAGRRTRRGPAPARRGVDCHANALQGTLRFARTSLEVRRGTTRVLVEAADGTAPGAPATAALHRLRGRTNALRPRASLTSHRTRCEALHESEGRMETPQGCARVERRLRSPRSSHRSPGPMIARWSTFVLMHPGVSNIHRSEPGSAPSSCEARSFRT